MQHFRTITGSLDGPVIAGDAASPQNNDIICQLIENTAKRSLSGFGMLRPKAKHTNEPLLARDGAAR